MIIREIQRWPYVSLESHPEVAPRGCRFQQPRTICPTLCKLTCDMLLNITTSIPDNLTCISIQHTVELRFYIPLLKMTLAYGSTYITTRSEAGYYPPSEIADSNHKTASDSGTSMSDETLQTIDSSVTSNSAEKMDVHNHEEDNITQYLDESNTIRDYQIDSVYSRDLPALSTTVSH